MLLSLALACTPSPGPTGPVEVRDTATSPGDTAVPTAGDDGLVVLSLNLQCLKTEDSGYATNAERWAAIAAHVAAEGVHVLAVQEACVADVDALAELAAALEASTGESWDRAWAFAHLAWEGTPDQADEGVGLLSRRGLSDPVELHMVSPGALQRVALLGRLDDGTVVVSVHHDRFDDAAREDQGRQVASQSLAASDTLDLVLAGDFNDVAGSPAHQAPLDLGFVDASARLEASRIDHVMVHRGSRWGPGDAALVLTEPPVSDHPGVQVRLLPQTPLEVPVTVIDARIDVGFGAHLAVRGDAAPLSWERGWWGHPVGADHWRFVFTELEGTFAFKTLIDDVVWQTGDDVTGEAGTTIELFPEY